jgi:hypothetical protein
MADSGQAISEHTGEIPHQRRPLFSIPEKIPNQDSQLVSMLEKYLIRAGN